MRYLQVCCIDVVVGLGGQQNTSMIVRHTKHIPIFLRKQFRNGNCSFVRILQLKEIKFWIQLTDVERIKRKFVTHQQIVQIFPLDGQRSCAIQCFRLQIVHHFFVALNFFEECFDIHGCG